MTNRVNLHFYGELNDFLPQSQRDTEFKHELKKPGSIKDLIESVGVPHTEVDLIFVNNSSVDFNYQVRHGDDIRIYPVLNSLPANVITELPPPASSHIHNHPEPMKNPRFVLDVHLGRLVAYLRILGFDTLYQNDYDDPTLARISAEESRILLTCDRKLLMRKQITYGYFVRERRPHQQLQEVMLRFELFNKEQPVTRCADCNGIIREVDKKEIESQLLPKTKKHYSEFFQCESCNKIYWEGSHYQNMQKMINSIQSL